MEEYHKIYKIDSNEFKLRKELLAENWDLYVQGSNILYAIRERKIKVDDEQKEIEINAGDFTREEFLQFVSYGFVDSKGNNSMSVEQCSQLSMKDSLEGFTNFFFHNTTIKDIITELNKLEEQIAECFEEIEHLEEQLNEYSNEIIKSTIEISLFDNWFFYLSDYDLTKRKAILKETLKLFMQCFYKKRLEDLNQMIRIKNRLQNDYEKIRSSS